MGKYPKVIINLQDLRENAAEVVRRCSECGVEVVGIMKGANGIPEVSRAYAEGGVSAIGSSRLDQLQTARDFGVEKPLMLIRTAMLSEVEDVVRIADVSLESEIKVIEALNIEARRQDKVHNVILMLEVGDLREGWYDMDELCEAALYIEKKLDSIYLMGLGVNVGCYGAIVPTADKLQELVDAAEKIESVIGRKLDILSGGASTSLMRVWDGDMPERINQVRIGGEIMMNFTNRVVYGYDMSSMHTDVFRLQAEVISVRQIAGGQRLMLFMGSIDCGNPDDLLMPGDSFRLSGASCDCISLDVTESSRTYAVGDIIEFPLRYSPLVFLTKSKSVKIEFVTNN